MDALKAAIYILMVTAGVNAVLLMMNEVGMTVMTPYNTTQWDAAFNATEIVESWGWQENNFYDIATGLISFWYAVRKLIEGVPMMLEAVGVPAFIYGPIYTVYRLLWVIAIALGIIAGRQT
ncbi:unnamed protein product [marine sediment metagenome]|uniref:Uncharacterized protein n=1 Tax=marine sediment metagenome TaxID=412755 RepID=X1ALA2_9ZZZZ